MKKKVLLYWFEMPGRPELLDIFVFNDPSIEFVHVYHASAKERVEKFSPYKMIYWFDYSSPFALLKAVKPDLVVTANGDGLYEVALLIAANHLGIVTYCVQHGLVAPSIYEEMDATKLKRTPGKMRYYFKALWFYMNLMRRLHRREKKQILSFLVDFIREGHYTACMKNRFPLRLPSRYICFTRFNAHYFSTRDGNIDKKIIEIGVPYFDYIFHLGNEPKKNGGEPYLLFIDTRLIKDGFPVTADVMNRYYQKLNTFAKARDLKLKIKLHPWSYKETALLQDDNILYLRDLQKEALIAEVKNAAVIFSFFSTLLVPIFFLHNKVVAVEYEGFPFPTDMKEGNELPVVNLYNEVPRDFDLSKVELNGAFRQRIKEKYLYSTDGRSKERLKQAIVSPLL